MGVAGYAETGGARGPGGFNPLPEGEQYVVLLPSARLRPVLSALGEGIEATGAAGASGLRRARATHVVRSPATVPGASIEIPGGPRAVAYEGLTLRSPRDGRTLIRASRSRCRTAWGPQSGARARSAGGALPCHGRDRYAGAGRIVAPGLDEILFLPERPYLPPARSGNCSCCPSRTRGPRRSDFRHSHGPRPRRGACAGRGLMSSGMGHILSLDEQQLSRRPRAQRGPALRFPGPASHGPQPGPGKRVLQLLFARSISYVTITENRTSRPIATTAVLDLTGGGAWTWSQIPP